MTELSALVPSSRQDGASKRAEFPWIDGEREASDITNELPFYQQKSARKQARKGNAPRACQTPVTIAAEKRPEGHSEHMGHGPSQGSISETCPSPSGKC